MSYLTMTTTCLANSLQLMDPNVLTHNRTRARVCVKVMFLNGYFEEMRARRPAYELEKYLKNIWPGPEKMQLFLKKPHFKQFSQNYRHQNLLCPGRARWTPDHSRYYAVPEQWTFPPTLSARTGDCYSALTFSNVGLFKWHKIPSRPRLFWRSINL